MGDDTATAGGLAASGIAATFYGQTPTTVRQATGRRSPTVCDEVSERRACAALGTDRTAVRYRSRSPGDGAVRARLRELAAVRPQFGYRLCTSYSGARA